VIPRAAYPLAVAALVTAAARQAPAQHADLALEVGGGTIARSSLGASLVAGQARVGAGGTTLDARARYARLDGGLAAYDAALAATLRSRLGRAITGELGASFSDAAAPTFVRRRRADLGVAPWWSRGRSELGLIGRVSRFEDGESWGSSTYAGFAARRIVGLVSFAASSGATMYSAPALVTRDTAYLVGGYEFRSTRQELVPQRFARVDLELTATVVAAGTEWSASGGLRPRRGRAGEGAYVDPEEWVRLTGAVPLTRSLLLVGEVGKQARIPEQRLPGGRFATVGLRVRWAGERRGPPAHPVVQPALLLGPAAADGEREMRLVGLSARERVEVMGDFTQWTPRTLRRAADGSWALRLPLPLGMHRLVVREDDGRWLPPPSLPTTPDEFQGEVGVLLVEW
jgi:hypothetical protein